MKTSVSSLPKPLLLTVLLFSALWSTSAQTLPAKPLSIVAPAIDSVQFGQRAKVEVSATEPLQCLQLFVTSSSGLRDVTSRLHPLGRDRWEAELSSGRDLALGRDTIRVTALRSNGEQVHVNARFYFARPESGLLSLASSDFDFTRSPVQVTAQLAPDATLRATLNGNDVQKSFKKQSNGLWQASLGADEGLRFGHNKLEVIGLNAAGTGYESADRVFFINRDAPLVGAGPDLVATVGMPLPLDGSATQPFSKKSNLSLHWKLVLQPAGSAAGLLGETNVKPGFVPDVPGRYRFELSASVPGKVTTVDSLEAEVQPDILPSGVPIETIVSTSNPGVQVGPNFYSLGDNWAQMVVLDRTTLELQKNNVYSTDGNNSLAQIINDLGAVQNGSLVILSGSGGQNPLNGSSFEEQLAFLGALAKLGYSDVYGNGHTLPPLLSGSFSLIGIAGSPNGSAYQFIGLQRTGGAPIGDMNGFFQLDSSGNFAFTWPTDYIPFDTFAPNSSLGGQTVISIGEQTWQTNPGEDPNTSDGFSLFWFDADSLNFRSAKFISILDLSPLAALLQTIANDSKPALIMVVSDDGPQPIGNSGDWAVSAVALAPFGANPQVFLGLDGSGNYSFLGLTNLGRLGPNQGVELSQVVTHAPSHRITGLLTRNRQGMYVGKINGPPDPVSDLSVYQNGLQQILAQQAQAFPALNPDAESYIAGKLGLQLDPVFGIRGNYWQNGSITWADQLGILNAMAPCTSDPCAAAFGSAKSQLAAEFGDVDQVRSYFTGQDSFDLNQVFNRAYVDSTFGFVAITNQILKTYNTPPSGTQADDPMQIFNASLQHSLGPYRGDSRGRQLCLRRSRGRARHAGNYFSGHRRLERRFPVRP